MINEFGGDAIAATASNLSEIIIYKNFKPDNKFMVYLYAYIGDFS